MFIRLICSYIFGSGMIFAQEGESPKSLPYASVSEQGTISFQFQQTPLENVLELYGALSGRSILLDPFVYADNFSTNASGLSTAQALDVIETLLHDRGNAVLLWSNRVAVIHPVDQVPSLPAVAIGMEPPKSGLISDDQKSTVRLSLNFLPVENVFTQYRELVDDDVLVADNLLAVLMSFRSRENMTRYEAVHTIEAALHLHRFRVVRMSDDLLRITGPKHRNDIRRSRPRPHIMTPSRVHQPPAAVQPVQPRPSDEEIAAHLLEYQREVIRKGLPLIPKPITPEAVE